MQFDKSKAIIEEKKIAEYLLAIDHPIGGGKARYFSKMGFDRDKPSDFSRALREHLLQGTILDPVDTGFGTKWVCRGLIESPTGIQKQITSVWILDSSGTFPRLVTAYPSKGEGI